MKDDGLLEALRLELLALFILLVDFLALLSGEEAALFCGDPDGAFAGTASGVIEDDRGRVDGEVIDKIASS